MRSEALGDAIEAFISATSTVLAALSGKPESSFLADAANETANVVGGVIAADGRTTDGELDAYLDTIGPLLSPPLVVSTAAARELDLFKGRTQSLTMPSVMFDLLCRADLRHGTRHAQQYYELTLRLAHVAAAMIGPNTSSCSK